MNVFNAVLFAVVLIFNAFNKSYAQANCQLRKDEDGIKVYTCHVDTSKFKSIVTEFDIACSGEDLIQAVSDIPNYAKWQFNTMEGKVLKTISYNEKIYRTIVAAPWPVTDRDMVVHLRITRTENEILITTDSEDGIFPEQADLVRVPFSHAQWIVTQKDKNLNHVRYTMLINPGGAVPAWLVNWTCANAPLQSFQNLKRMLEKK